MAARKAEPADKVRQDAPPTTPEAWENRIIAKTYRLAEKQIDNGTVSSQVMTHFLKLGTAKEELEKEKLRNENLLIAARVSNLASEENRDTLYAEAIRVMTEYRGDVVE